MCQKFEISIFLLFETLTGMGRDESEVEGENLDDWMHNYQDKKKPVFAVLMEPYNRWLEGLRYWLMEWQIAEKDRKLWDISRDSPLFFEKFNWPRMGNHTKTMTECLSGIKIDGETNAFVGFSN